MLSKNQLGFLYMFMSICAFSIMDLIVKWSEHYPLGQVLFLRGFFGGITMILLFYAYTLIPLSQAMAISFSTPLFIYFGSIFFSLL